MRGRPRARPRRASARSRGERARVAFPSHPSSPSITPLAFARASRRPDRRRSTIPRDRCAFPRGRSLSRRRRARRAVRAPFATRRSTKKRTWTLVALKAATRPTKEEARRADIVLCVCWNAGHRARGDGIAFVPNVRSYHAHQYCGSPSPVRDDCVRDSLRDRRISLDGVHARSNAWMIVDYRQR